MRMLAGWRGRGRQAGEGAAGGQAGEAQKIDRCRRGMAPAGGGGELRGEAQKIGGCGRGLFRLTRAAAPRPGLWPDDEERALEGERALWLDERAAALCGPRAEDRVRCVRGDARANAAAGGERQNRISEL
jgi:hypothetical protein